MGGEGSLGKNGYIICMAESIRCSPETITLLIGYTPIQNKKFIKKKKKQLMAFDIAIPFFSQRGEVGGAHRSS